MITQSKYTLTASSVGKQELRLVLVLHLIGWEGGMGFLDQSQSIVKQNQCKPKLLLTLN